VNRGGTCDSLLPLNIGERGLAHSDLPGEFRLMPAVLFAKTTDSWAILTQLARCPTR
jgi:hypothetical protein